MVLVHYPSFSVVLGCSMVGQCISSIAVGFRCSLRDDGEPSKEGTHTSVVSYKPFSFDDVAVH